MDSIRCSAPTCEREAAVFLAGQGLCAEHYLKYEKRLNEVGLTPRGIKAELRRDASSPMERRIQIL